MKSGHDLTGYTIYRTRFNWEAAKIAMAYVVTTFPDLDLGAVVEVLANDTSTKSIVGVKPERSVFDLITHLDLIKTHSDILTLADLYESNLNSMVSDQVNENATGKCNPKKNEVRVLGFAGGSSANRCLNANFHKMNATINERNINVNHDNVTFRMASAAHPTMRFVTKGSSTVTCNNIIVAANGFSLPDATFDQTACTSGDEHTLTPVVFRGDSTKNSHLNYTVAFRTLSVVPLYTAS